MCACTMCIYIIIIIIIFVWRVGGAIGIRDPYICAVHESVPMNRTLSSAGPLSVQ